MNAYIASFMLLVFNAVGLAMPATEAVAEERIAANPKIGETPDSVEPTTRATAVGEVEKCAIAYGAASHNKDNHICLLIDSNAQRIAANTNIIGVEPIWAHLPIYTKMADNRHVEGAP